MFDNIGNLMPAKTTISRLYSPFDQVFDDNRLSVIMVQQLVYIKLKCIFNKDALTV